jgi:hypothetical protein
MENEPKTIQPVDLTRLHYSVKTEKDPAAYVREQLKGSDYELQKLNRGVAHFTRKSDGSHHLSSIKGTDPSMFKDLMSDANLELVSAQRTSSLSDARIRSRKSIGIILKEINIL